MKLSIIVLGLGLLMIPASAAISVLGIQYEISKIPPEIRAGMADTEWIGVEWIGRGAVVFLAAILTQIVGTIFLITSVKYKQRKIAREASPRAILI